MSACVRVNGMRTSRLNQPDWKYYDVQRELRLAMAEDDPEGVG